MSRLLIRCILLQAAFYAVVSSETGTSILSAKAEDGLIPRVENGTKVRQGRYAWMIALLRGEKIICSAALISTKTALSAAHCFLDVRRVYEIHGRIGNPRWRDGELISFSEIKSHENYNPNISPYLNDIALLILRHPIELSVRIKTIALPMLNFLRNGTIHFSGWGSCTNDINGQSATLRMGLWSTYFIKYTAEERQNMSPLELNSVRWATSKTGRRPCPRDFGGPWIHGKGNNKLCLAVQSQSFRTDVAGDKYLGISTGFYAEWIALNAIGEITFI